MISFCLRILFFDQLLDLDILVFGPSGILFKIFSLPKYNGSPIFTYTICSMVHLQHQM